MADDIEAFLRRAAQRRKQQAAGAKPAARRPRPEYTNAREERRVETVQAEEIIEAEIIDDGISTLENRHLQDTHLAEKVALADDKMEDHIHQVFDHEVGHLSHEGRGTGRVPVDRSVVNALVKMLSTPTGVRQAILAREILDRPEHRW